ncbi:TPA: hypothetical protein I9Z81_001039 [Clostridium perfringens]|nr:hypothetical protein [Clostridium perfringens]
MSYRIEDTEKYMTIFFSKMDGEIMNTTAGKETMFFFADREKEYSLIWDYIQMPYVAEVMHYPQLFKVVDGELTLKSTAFANLKIVK